MALACEPRLVVLDEPTTGLDVTTQEQIIDLLVDLRARLGMSMLYVTHDLGLLSQIADRIGVMYAGQMVEVAPTVELFSAPRHPYTRGLIAALPRIDGDGRNVKPLRGLLQRDSLPRGCHFAPRCDFAMPRCFEEAQVLSPVGTMHEAACWRVAELPPNLMPPSCGPALPAVGEQDVAPLLSVDSLTVCYGNGMRSFTALKDVSLTVGTGETLALVGESGSGKSTLARAIAGMFAPTAGAIRLNCGPLEGLVSQRNAEQRRLIQYIFQNPDASLNPRATIGRSLARPFSFFFPEKAGSEAEKILLALDDVRLDAGYAARYPDQLSGGERQRVAVARALASNPAIVFADEPTGNLDRATGAIVADMLFAIARQRNATLVVVTHDAEIAKRADRIVEMSDGRVV